MNTIKFNKDIIISIQHFLTVKEKLQLAFSSKELYKFCNTNYQFWNAKIQKEISSGYSFRLDQFVEDCSCLLQMLSYELNKEGNAIFADWLVTSPMVRGQSFEDLKKQLFPFIKTINYCSVLKDEGAEERQFFKEILGGLLATPNYIKPDTFLMGNFLTQFSKEKDYPLLAQFLVLNQKSNIDSSISKQLKKLYDQSECIRLYVDIAKIYHNNVLICSKGQALEQDYLKIIFYEAKKYLCLKSIFCVFSFFPAHFDIFKLVLTKQPDLLNENLSGLDRSLLHLAIANTNSKMVNHLLEQGACPNAMDGLELVQEKENLLCKPSKISSPLLLALECLTEKPITYYKMHKKSTVGELTIIIQNLLDKGADVNLKSGEEEDRRTPLQFCEEALESGEYSQVINETLGLVLEKAKISYARF